MLQLLVSELPCNNSELNGSMTRMLWEGGISAVNRGVATGALPVYSGNKEKIHRYYSSSLLLKRRNLSD